MRYRFIALPVAALASLALASVALAGGWAQVTAKDIPNDPPAGEETTIGLNVLQHGVTPVSWPSLTVIATDATSGAVVRAEAQTKGAEGTYVARIVFPSAGDWNLTFESAELEMGGSVAMSVAPVLAVAPPVAAAQPAAASPGASPTTSAFDATPLLLLLVAAALALAAVGLVLRNGRASTDKRVPVRN